MRKLAEILQVLLTTATRLLIFVLSFREHRPLTAS